MEWRRPLVAEAFRRHPYEDDLTGDAGMIEVSREHIGGVDIAIRSQWGIAEPDIACLAGSNGHRSDQNAFEAKPVAEATVKKDAPRHANNFGGEGWHRLVG